VIDDRIGTSTVVTSKSKSFIHNIIIIIFNNNNHKTTMTKKQPKKPFHSNYIEQLARKLGKSK